MLAITRTAALAGIEGISVRAEVDVGRGLPAFHVIGLGDTAVKEAADRVKGAIINSGFLPPLYARSLKPFDAGLLAHQRAEGRRIVSLENGCIDGGFGESLGADLRFGWPDAFIPHGAIGELEKRHGLDVDSMAAKIAAFSREEECHTQNVV